MLRSNKDSSNSLLTESYRIGMVIKSLRLTKKISQSALSKGICNRVTLCNLEAGHVMNPSFQLIAQLCDRLETPIEVLLNYDFGSTDLYTINSERIETMIFKEKHNVLLETVRDLESSKNPSCLYLSLLGSSYYFFKTNQHDKALHNLNEHFANNLTMRSLDDIRLYLSKMKLDFINKSIDSTNVLDSETKIIKDFSKILFNTPPYRDVRLQIHISLLLADLSRRVSLNDLFLMLIANAKKLIDDNNEFRFLGEVYLIEAGYLFHEGYYDQGFENLEKVRKIYIAFGITEKLRYVDYLEEVAFFTKAMQEDETNYTFEEYTAKLNSIKEKYGV